MRERDFVDIIVMWGGDVYIDLGSGDFEVFICFYLFYEGLVGICVAWDIVLGIAI